MRLKNQAQNDLEMLKFCFSRCLPGFDVNQHPFSCCWTRWEEVLTDSHASVPSACNSRVHLVLSQRFRY